MKKCMIIGILLFVWLETLSAQNTENVIIAVIDGSRYTETFGDPSHESIPKIWDDLRPMGTIYTSFYIDGRTATNPGHASILTGTWQMISNDGSERPDRPTVFEYFRKPSAAPVTDTYVVLGKSKLDILSHSTHAEYGNAYGASVKTSYNPYNDATTFENITEVIDTHHPRLMIINFAETDSRGHGGDWSEYRDAIRKVDILLYALWNYIQSDPVYKDKTTMFVTNDHGRHTNDFTGHGCNCEGCRHIMLLVIGPDTPAGMEDSTTRKQTDIAPTVGRLLNFETPYSTGNAIETAIPTHVVRRGMGEYDSVHNFELMQNYPNPFNAATTIHYFAGTPGAVQLWIHDERGRVVRTLHDDDNPPVGYRQIQWDGRDASGKPVASGMYFYTLRIPGDRSISRQMIMIR